MAHARPHNTKAHGTKALVLLAALAALIGVGCRGEISRKPPVHIVWDMDFQEKIKAQSKVEFPGWKDNRGMRAPVAGTIARGHLGALDPDPDVARLYVYLKPNKDFVTKNPLPLTKANLDLGRQQYDIHCAICHGRTGRGNGPVGLRLPIQPPSYLSVAGPVPFPDRAPGEQKADRMDERVQSHSDGAIFNVITNGFQVTMPAYGPQIPVKERWAIIHYIRALQLRVK